ncbi:MAG TPA: VOC family protein [Stellaceae bacterium]|nr:VOC family protein [Stellaceae bacterium]
MRSGIAGLDHVIVAVRDLEAARRGWERLGFTTTPRGRHVGPASANYCIMFPEDYIELLAPAPDGDRPERLAAFLRHREGLMAAAFAPSGNAAQARAALLAAGVHPNEPQALGRHIDLPEGAATARFSLLTLPAEETPGLDCFICGHLTPELVRRPDWLRHPNGAGGVRGLYVLVADTATLLPAYDRLLGLHQVTTTDAVASVRIGNHRIVFLTPDDFLTMHPGLDLDPDLPLPAIVALELRVAQIEETAAYLDRAGVSVLNLGGGIAVPPREANGAYLFFTG